MTLRAAFGVLGAPRRLRGSESVPPCDAATHAAAVACTSHPNTSAASRREVGCRGADHILPGRARGASRHRQRRQAAGNAGRGGGRPLLCRRPPPPHLGVCPPRPHPACWHRHARYTEAEDYAHAAACDAKPAAPPASRQAVPHRAALPLPPLRPGLAPCAASAVQQAGPACCPWSRRCGESGAAWFWQRWAPRCVPTRQRTQARRRPPAVQGPHSLPLHRASSASVVCACA